MDYKTLFESGVEICVPSYKRPENMRITDWLDGLSIWVHDFEYDDYVEANPGCNIVSMPDDLSGSGMADIRNYILDNSNKDWVLMIDDDCRGVGYYENCEAKEFGKEEFFDFVLNGFVMAEDLGTCLWGLNQQTDKKFYREYSPLSMTVPVLGPFMGIIKMDRTPRFDPDLGLKEDYDYSIQVLNRFRKILRFNKYHYKVGHIDYPGGCTTYRTKKKELEQGKRLQRKWAVG